MRVPRRREALEGWRVERRRGLRVAGAWVLALALGLPGAARAQEAESPRAAGDALRAELGRAAPRQELVGQRRLPVLLGGVRAGSLVLRTQVVERDGAPIYRLDDRLEVELPGAGLSRLLVRADLRADLSALEVVVETEEPRGPGRVSRQRVELRREPAGVPAAGGPGGGGSGAGGRWVRRVARGDAAPRDEPLDEGVPLDALVLTPPLGAGERLARLVPEAVGRRLSVRGLDLETGQGATWRLSVEGVREVSLDGAPRRALALVRQEGAASLAVLRDAAAGGPPLRLALAEVEGDARLLAHDPALAWLEPTGAATDGPVPAFVAWLRALAAGDRDAIARGLDPAALHAAAGGPDTGVPLADFEAALLRRLGRSGWLAERALLLAAVGATPVDFEARPRPDGTVEVRARGASPAVVLAPREGGRWVLVAVLD